MELQELNYYYKKFKFGDDNYYDLMKFRIREILLVASFYDSYAFEQESRLSQQIASQYHLLNLTTIPRITAVPTAEEAWRRLNENQYDLVIVTLWIGKQSPYAFSKKIKEKFKDLPVLLLLTNRANVNQIMKKRKQIQFIDRVFLWHGDSKLLLAMIKYIEDQKNIINDTQKALVRVILLMEKSIPFYSSYLPLLYSEIMNQTQRIIQEELNDIEKYHRMRQRPKVLLAKTYAEGRQIIQQFKEYLLCVIFDASFLKSQGTNKNYIKNKEEEQLFDLDIPLLLQSSNLSHKKIARQLNIGFLYKKSPIILNDLRNFILNHLGFGDFVFRDKQGQELGRAHSSIDLEKKLTEIPIESVIYHSQKNHFSAWLLAHSENQVAKKIKPIQTADFPDPEAHRDFLIQVFKDVREQKGKGKIIDFSLLDLNHDNRVIRLSEGSLGGKGRGIAFLNALLATIELDKKYPGTRIIIPQTAIIGTAEYDQFIQKHQLMDLLAEKDDLKIKEKFLAASLSAGLVERLKSYLQIVSKPLAIRSSGLLEDSQSQPFAGIYQTFMVPNNHPDLEVRLRQLTNAVKLVFASCFLKNARIYIDSLNYRVEEEKMAVVIQEIAGTLFQDHYYPHISGVAQSYNFYPTSFMKHSDGVSMIALGLGQSVVEGEKNYRFCPQYPSLQYLSTDDLLKYSQTEFYAIDMTKNNTSLVEGDHSTLIKLKIRTAEQDHALYHLASVWDVQNRRIEDGLSLKGPRILNFANVLKYDYFPLANILVDILDICETAFGVPVEIEYAVNLSKDPRRKILPAFYLLQVRPLTVQLEDIDIEEYEENRQNLILYTEDGMGHGIIDSIQDIIYLDPARFDKTMTEEMSREIEQFNEEMNRLDKEYILIGPGRWGSRDRFLGIPVKWPQINRAKIIVESGLKDFDIDPSQGTHFFHNLVSMNIGYFNISYHNEKNHVDWPWLISQAPVRTGKYFKQIKTAQTFKVSMDGKKGLAIIHKPNPIDQ